MKSQTINDEGVVLPLFGKPYTPQPRKPIETRSVCGSPIIYRADLSIDPSGTKLAKVGQALDLDAMIQAALPTTDIAAIVARAKMGDESVLHVNPGFVGDSVSLPKDLYDYKRMNDLYDKVSSSFETLPAEVKALFDNDSATYLNSILSGKANEIVENYNKSKEVKEANENA